jgi:hypothetical protein
MDSKRDYHSSDSTMIYLQNANEIDVNFSFTNFVDEVQFSLSFKDEDLKANGIIAMTCADLFGDQILATSDGYTTRPLISMKRSFHAPKDLSGYHRFKLFNVENSDQEISGYGTIMLQLTRFRSINL